MDHQLHPVPSLNIGVPDHIFRDIAVCRTSDLV